MKTVSWLLYVLVHVKLLAALQDNPPVPQPLPPWQSVLSDDSTEPSISLTQWNVASKDAKAGTNATQYSIAAQVPGDLLTDLYRAGIIQDPYFDRNFLTQRHVWMGPQEPASLSRRTNASGSTHERTRTRTWIYSTQFTLPDTIDGRSDTTFILVAESIKMGALLELNGVAIGTATNQFRRYMFDLTQLALQRGSIVAGKMRQHELKIVFDPAISTDGRFMACSGGWDWAPYSRSIDDRGSRIMTLGIPRPIYAVAVQKAIITDVVPRIYYQGEYSLAPMWNGPEGDFLLSVHVHVRVLDSAALQDYRIVARAEFITDPIVVPLSQYDGQKITINMTAFKDDIELWWPNGLGSQRMYWLDITLDNGICSHKGSCQTFHQRLGFRTVALVTANESNSEILLEMKDHSSQGSGRHGMYFRINGAVLWARGANIVPMSQLEGRVTDEALMELIYSAAKVNMNMLRVWGGGTIPSKAFYEACDEVGILLYHDLMFVEEGHHGAVRTEEVREEIIHTIRKLISHPSIVLWNGCNECSGRALDMHIYESFVLQTVADEDDTRPIWASSPSLYGWATGVSRLDGRPNGERLRARHWTPNDTHHAIELHGPYQRGYSLSFPAVNGRRSGNTDETLVPPFVTRIACSGVECVSTFVSEFGATGFSSFESMAALLPYSAWSVHGGTDPDTCEQVIENENTCIGSNPMAERNYPCDNRIELYFGNRSNLDAVSATLFQRQLYECMLAQALWMKGRIEMTRAGNSFGTLIWQLNENWPTGGWGCIEYGPSKQSKGQIVGGRWKPLLYLLSRRLFQDSIVACAQDSLCYARDDSATSTEVQAKFEAWRLGEMVPLQTWSLNHTHGYGRSTAYFRLPGNFCDDADVVLIQSSLRRKSGDADLEAFLWKVPRDLSRLALPVSFTVNFQMVFPSEHVRIELSSDSLALYVVMSTAANGRFSDNALHLRPGLPRRILFDQVSFDESVDFALLVSTFRIEHLGTTRNVDVTITDDTAIK